MQGLYRETVGSHLFKQLYSVCGTRCIICVFIRVPTNLCFESLNFRSRHVHLNLPVALSSHLQLGLPSCVFPSCFLTKVLYAFLTFACMLHSPLTRITCGRRGQIIFLIYNLLRHSLTSCLLCLNISPVQRSLLMVLI